MTLAALGLVAVWLWIFFRRLTKMVLTLIPVLIAVGLSSLVIYATGMELSPLTAVSGPLVIAVCTEFAVLIMSRYVEERERGAPRSCVARGACASAGPTWRGFTPSRLRRGPRRRPSRCWRFGSSWRSTWVVALVCA